MFGLWLISLFDWLAFSIANIVGTNHEDWYFLWVFNFCQMVFVVIVMFLTTIFCGISYRIVIILSKTYKNKQNKKQLQDLKIVSGTLIFPSIFLTATLFAGLGA